MLERTDAVTNEVLEPITFVLAYLTVDTEKNRRTQQKLFISCYSRQLVSTQLWGHHQAINKNWRNKMYMAVTRDSHSVYIGCSTYRVPDIM
jgi:hypothetical protein